MWKSFLDAGEQVVKTVDPLGLVSTILRDADGNPTAMIDPRGKMSTKINNDNEQTTDADPLGHGSTQYFDKDGNVTGTLDARGESREYFDSRPGHHDHRPVEPYDQNLFRRRQ